MVGKRIRELRKKAGLTQKQLAEIIGVNLDTVSRYERDIVVPHDDTKINIAKTFGISLDYLIGAVDQPYPLNRDVIHLPADFPENLKQELALYADFLAYRSKLDPEKQEALRQWLSISTPKQEAILRLMEKE